MKVLITGCCGFLGSNLGKSLARSHEIVGTDIRTSENPWIGDIHVGDLLDAASVDSLLAKTCPQAVINTVALPDVDRCEREPLLARKMNVDTARVVATAAANRGLRLIHISTDHLFDGSRSFYSEEDPPAPVNQYASTKLEAEYEVISACPSALIVRTNFFGWSPHGHVQTFAEWVFCSLRDQKRITLFDDYYFTPIEVTSLAEILDCLVSMDTRGLLNVAGAQRCSKYEFGLEMGRVFGLSCENIVRASKEDTTGLVRRPADLSLNVNRAEQLVARKMPDLRDGMQRLKRTMPS